VEKADSNAIEVIGIMRIVFASLARVGNRPSMELHQDITEKLGESLIIGGS
jgi:hypothetical protein